MNKIFKIIWNATTQTWVVVSELTRAHTKRASATVATAVLATALSATVQASGTDSDYDPNAFDPNNPKYTDEAVVSDTYRFGLAVLDESGKIKDNKLKDQDFDTDEEKSKYTISVEDTESEHALPKYSSSFLYLKENGGIELEQDGRLAKFKVKTGDGLKIDENNDNKLVADTVGLTVNNGKVGDVNDNESKLVNAGSLKTALNELGWRLTDGTNTSTVKSGEEVEFKGEGVTVKTENKDGKHIVTITAQTQPQTGGNTGGAWKAVAAASGTGEVDPENPTEQEVKAGDKVTFKAGDNLKVKQSGKDFTYSLKETLTGLTSITLGNTANGGTTVINKDGLTITPATGAGTNDVNKISVTKDGIKAGNKEITNVASALKTYKDAQNGAGTQPTANTVEAAKQDLVDLTKPVAGAAGNGADAKAPDTTAATVGDLRGLGWVLSSDKTTDDTTGTKAFHAAVKNATEVEFVGKNGATVSAKTDTATGKHTVTVDVATVEANGGLKKDGNTIKLNTKTGDDNLLKVNTDGTVEVTKGGFADVDTAAPAAGQGATANANRGKVVVKASANGGQATADDDKKVATVGDVAKAINDAATFVKVENDDTATIDGSPADDGKDDALKAGDTLTLKAGKNLKVKREGKEVTFALAKDLDVKTAKVSDTLTIGGNTPATGGDKTPKVNVTSTAGGLNFAKSGVTGNDANVHLTGIASTLQDTLLNAGTTKTVTKDSVTSEEKQRAASVQDVLNAGWNIRGVKPTSTNNQVENIDFVATYDTVDFVSKDDNTTSVTVESQDNGKRTEVKIGAKTSVIKEKDGKLVTGKNLKAADNAATISDEDAKDDGKGLVTAKTVIDAVNKAGWRVKTTDANGQDGKFETVTSGTNVTFASGNGTTAVVTSDATNGITVKYEAKVGDGLKLDGDKITANTTALTVNNGNEADKPKGKVANVAENDKKKLVKADDLVTALNSLSWTATADKDGTGEAEGQSDEEVKAGDKVTFTAGDNLKVKQSGKDFTYSLKESLTGLKDITLNKASDGSTNSVTTKITNDGLTITPAGNAGATGTDAANTISVTKDGIKAGNQQITNVASALKTYKDAQNGGTQPTAGSVEEAKQNLVKLDDVTNTAAGGTATTDNGLKNKAATVGDLAGLGWVLSADKTTKDDNSGVNDTAFHAAVKNANEVEFKGKGATVSAKTDTATGKHTVTIDVKEVEAGNGLEKTDNTIKLKVKNKAGEENLLTVDADGASVTKGEFNTVVTDVTTAAGQGGNVNTNDRGKVTVKASAAGADAAATDADKKKVATVGDVADAINSASTFVKVQSTNDDIEDSAAGENETTDEALKAGDTLTLKAGKNLKVKREGKEVTFALAKDITTENATFSNKLSIGGATTGATTTPKVDITSTADGLNFANATAVNGDTKVHLNNIASSLTDPRVGGNTAHVTLDTEVRNQISNRAASVKDVLSAGWNIRGVKPTSTNNQVENIDFVATYDTVDFVSKDDNTTSVTVESQDNGKRTEVKIGAKTSVIKEKDGKLVTGKESAVAGTTDAADNDTGTGLVTAKTVIEAVNKAGWRIKTTQGANAQAGQFETVASGTNVTFADGKGTTATVTKDDQKGITVTYNAKVGDGLKIGDGDKITADTTALTVNSTDGDAANPKGKVANVAENDKKKLVNAESLVTALNSLSWTATAAAGDDGKLDGTASKQEVKAGETVTFKAGKNLKVKQDGANFTYSLNDTLTGLTSITLDKAANGGATTGATTKITNDGLTITPANAGATDASVVSVTKDGIKAGNKEITNVKSALKTYGANNGVQTQPQPQPAATTVAEAKQGLVNLDTTVTPAAGGNGADAKAPDTTAATVGDLRGLGWVLSSDKTTKADGTGVEDNKAFHAAVKNATEVEFVGTGSATVSAKTDGNKHVVTVNVKEAELGDGLEKTADGKIKVKASTDANNVLTVNGNGASVTKGTLEVVGASANGDKKGQVKAKGADGNNAAETDKSVATVKSVADAINSVSTFVKAENTDDEINDNPVDNGTNDALKAGDTLTLKAGKNLKVKREGKDVTFALAKDLDVKTAKVSDTLTIGGNTPATGGDKTPKVNVTSTAGGLNFAKSGVTGNDANVHLTGIASTLQDTLLNAGTTKTVTKNNVTEDEKQRAASVQDVLNAGWNIRGVKSASTNNQVEDVDFVATYDKVEFLSASTDTTTVTVDSEDNGKTTKVKIGAKTSVIKEKDGKLVTGKEGAVTGTPNDTEDADEGKGLVTAKTVIEAVNKAGWRIKTTANGQAGQGNFETVTSGTNVTFADGNATTAIVSKDNKGNITVKYDVNVGDGLKLSDDGTKITADTTALTVAGGKVTAPTADAEKKKLVNAENLATALNDLSWTATAGKDGGELDGEAKDQEVKAGDKVTFKAGKNLKVKQDGANFTYSLNDTLTGLTSITLGKDNDVKTVINKDGLTITPVANGATDTANAISVTKDGIKAGNKAIDNVASALTTYGNNQNAGQPQTQPQAGSVEAAKQNLVKLDDVTTPAAGGTTANNDLAKKAATVGAI